MGSDDDNGRDTKWIAVLVAVIGAVAVVLAAVLPGVISEDAEPDDVTAGEPRPQAEITSLSPGTSVPYKPIEVEGVGSPDAELWLVVRSATLRRWFPEDASLEVEPNGMWRDEVVIGDDDTNPGETFIVAVVWVTDSEARETLQNFESCERHGDCFEMEHLPPGAEVVADVTVSRL